MPPEGLSPNPSIIFVAKVGHILNNQLNQLLKIYLGCETEFQQKTSVKFIWRKNTKYFILAVFGGCLLKISPKTCAFYIYKFSCVFSFCFFFFFPRFFSFLASHPSIAADVSLCSVACWTAGKSCSTINFQPDAAIIDFG